MVVVGLYPHGRLVERDLLVLAVMLIIIAIVVVWWVEGA